MRKDVLLDRISKELGYENECRVRNILRKLKREGKIVKFYSTNRRDDKFKGIDFFIIGIEGNKIPLQVKSSFTGAKMHRKKFPDIPVVVVNAENLKEVEKEIKSLVCSI